MEIVCAIVDELISSALSKVEGQRGRNVLPRRDSATTTIAAADVDVSDGSGGGVGGEEGVCDEREGDLGDVTVAEREADRQSRVQILLQLLELACAMVCG